MYFWVLKRTVSIRLVETVLLSTHNICFSLEIRKKTQIRTLIWRSVNNVTSPCPNMDFEQGILKRTDSSENVNLISIEQQQIF